MKNIRFFLRVINKYRSHYFINLSALAICVAAFAIITSYTGSQKSFDSFHANKDQIYRLINVRHYPTKLDKSAGCIEFVGTKIKESFPEVDKVVHITRRGNIIDNPEQDIYESQIFFTTPAFLSVFSFPVLQGNQKNYLEEPFTCLISERFAKKYFGNEDPIGKSLDINYGQPIVIDGILKDAPANSYFDFNILVSYSTLQSVGYCEGCNNKNTFLLLKPGTDKGTLELKLASFVKELHPDDEFKREYLLQPLSEINQNNTYRFEMGKTKDGKILSYLNIIAYLVLFISFINYLSINTIVSLKRLKENGIKAILGAKSAYVFKQLLLESFILIAFVVVLGFIVASILIPVFTRIFHIDYLVISTSVVVILVVFVVLGSFVTALFPFIQFKSIRIKNVFNLLKYQKSKSSYSRSTFIIAQYFIAILLISFSVSIFRQYKFMVDSELGFNTDNLLIVNNELGRGTDAYLNSLASYSEIEEITCSDYLPGTENGNVGGGYHLREQKREESIQIYRVGVKNNFFEMLGIDVLAGNSLKDFSLTDDNANRTNYLVLNETAAQQFGISNYDEIIGKSIYHDETERGIVTGVVKDFHQKSLDKPITPTIYALSNRKLFFIIRTNGTDIAQTIDVVQSEYKKISSSGVFNYFFMDDHFNEQYLSYAGFLRAINLFTILAIIICCVGLFSLVKYIIHIRTKEIGVRKVNGASVHEILREINKDIVKWILIAFVLAFPFAWFFIHKWLEGFAYKADINWWLFIISGSALLAVALLTVSWQSWRAAIRNPVEALRYE